MAQYFDLKFFDEDKPWRENLAPDLVHCLAHPSMRSAMKQVIESRKTALAEAAANGNAEEMRMAAEDLRGAFQFASALYNLANGD